LAIESLDSSVTITTPDDTHINLQATGVASLQGLNGTLAIESLDSSVTITTPDDTHINLQADGLVSNGCLTTLGANFFCSGNINGGTFAIDLGAADNTGVADASSYVNTAIAAQVTSYLGSGQTLPLPGGQFYAPSLSNIYGVPFSGMGRLLKPISQTSQNASNANATATQAQQNSYAYSAPRLIFGQEYASRWFGLVSTYQGSPSSIPAGGINIIMSGDSTTAGNNTTTGCPLPGGCTVDALFNNAAIAHGIQGVSAHNAGHAGKDTQDWLSSYLAGDQAANPDVYFIRWGINDAFFGLTPAQTVANIRTGLSWIRPPGPDCPTGVTCTGTHSDDQETIVLETPSSTNDNPNGRSPLFYEQLRNGFAQAARDFHTVFIDNYGAHPDNDFAVQASMMDAPYTSAITAWSIASNVLTFTSANSWAAGNTVVISGLTTGAFMNGQTLTVISTGLSGTYFEANFTHANGSATEGGLASMPGTTPVHIHPGGAKAPLYNRLLEQALFDPLDVYGSAQMANVSGATVIPTTATLGPNYPYEFSIYRTDGTWPFNGMVVTQHHVDGIWIQTNYPFGAGAVAFAVRAGTSTVWGSWTLFEPGGLNPNTLPSSSFSTGLYAGLSQLGLPDVIWSLQSNGTNLKLADTYEDTSGIMHFRFCNDTNSSCNDYITVTRSGNTPTAIAFATGISALGVAGSGTATFAAGAGAGTSPGTIQCLVSHVCDSVSGMIQLLTVGSSPPASGTILTVTLGSTRSNQPNCNVQAWDVSTGVPVALGVPVTTTTTLVSTLSGTALTAGHQVQFVYHCGGQ
jgi:hypothetical protein